MASSRTRVDVREVIAWLLGKGSVIRWQFLRFAGLSIAALFSRLEPSRTPVPKLTLRLGVAGHVDLPERANVTHAIHRILSALQHALDGANKEYLSAFRLASDVPQAECRLISQLAAGADQLVADQALRLGYTLQCILPIDMDGYAEDLRRHPGVDADPAGEMMRLAAAASAVLELDGEVDAATRSLSDRTYEISSLVMLDHADVLIALVRSDAEVRPGGTRWLIDEAERRGMPVLRVIVDAPETSQFAQGPAGARTSEPSGTAAWAPGLIRSMFLQPMNASEPTGWFEERFRARVKPQAPQWAPTWAPAAVSVQPQVERWMSAIDRDYFASWRWAEQCANAYRDLYQGAYVTTSLLGLAAVAGALLGALNPAWSPFGKWIEVGAITALLLLWQRAHAFRWRERWLGYRLLEQQVSHAAVLALVGRTVPTVDSPALREFRNEGAWIDSYLLAVIRQASLPSGTLDQASTVEIGRLIILSGMIGRQIEYYETAIATNEAANERLEAIAVLSLLLTFLTAALYLFVHHYADRAFHWPVDPFRQLALAAGVFLPALAATLAAIRMQGEFLQLATRYRGMRNHLRLLRDRLARTLDDAAAGPAPLLSAQIARYAVDAATSMLDEVSQWRSLLYTHEIER